MTHTNPDSATFQELYSDENLSKTIRDIAHGTAKEFDMESDEYNEHLKSRFLLLCRRIRDARLEAQND